MQNTLNPLLALRQNTLKGTLEPLQALLIALSMFLGPYAHGVYNLTFSKPILSELSNLNFLTPKIFPIRIRSEKIKVSADLVF
jgi:hypothetical protein